MCRHRTLKEIAKGLGFGITTVHRAVKAHGLTRSSVRRNRKALADKRWLRTRYITEGATARDVADELSVSVPTVRTALRLADIRRRARR